MASHAQQADIAFQQNLYEDSNATRRGLHLDRRAWVESALLEHLPASARVLEVGIGCGVFTRFLQQAGVRVTAVDINPAFVAGVAHLPKVRGIICDATQPMNLHLHDLALCTEVIEHVPPSSSLAMLRSIAASLKPGGRLVLTTPQRFATVELMARLLKVPVILALARKLYGSADELGHINLLTADALQAQIAKAGFVIERHERFGFYLPAIAEFGGTFGARVLKNIGRGLASLPLLRGLVWTQAYVLRKA